MRIFRIRSLYFMIYRRSRQGKASRRISCGGKAVSREQGMLESENKAISEYRGCQGLDIRCEQAQRVPGPWNRVGGIKGTHTHIMYVDMGGLTLQPPFLGTILIFSAVICLCSMFLGGAPFTPHPSASPTSFNSSREG